MFNLQTLAHTWQVRGKRMENIKFLNENERYMHSRILHRSVESCAASMTDQNSSTGLLNAISWDYAPTLIFTTHFTHTYMGLCVIMCKYVMGIGLGHNSMG